MSLVLVTAPTIEPLTAAEARARLAIDASVADAVINAFVSAARTAQDGASGQLGRALNTQTWKLVLDRFPASLNPRRHGHHNWPAIELPLPPLQQVTGITYLDSTGASQTLDPTLYRVVAGTPARIVPAFNASWPSTASVAGAVEVTFRAGYGDAGADVPEAIRTGIALQVGKLVALSQADVLVEEENVAGVGSTTYARDMAGAAGTLTSAAEALLSSFRMVNL